MRPVDDEGVVIRQGVHFRRVARGGKRCGQDTESPRMSLEKNVDNSAALRKYCNECIELVVCRYRNALTVRRELQRDRLAPFYEVNS